MLELVNLQKAYGAKTVLHCSALQLQPGLYSIRGDNGSGKTTFLKIVAGLLPYSGDVLFETISQKKEAVRYRQQVGWAEAEPLYPPFLSGMELLMLYQQIRKADANALSQVIDQFRLESYISNKIGTYSAGMCKKLSLALAFIGNPRLCVLDEPLITLDGEAVHSFCQHVQEHHKRFGTTFLLSSHQEPNDSLAAVVKKLCVNNRQITQVP